MSENTRGRSVALVLAALLAACSSTRTPYAGGRGPEHVIPAGSPAALAAAVPAARPTLRLADRRREYDVFDLELESVDERRGGREPVSARYFRHRGGGARPVVVVLPIWGRSGFPSWVTTRRVLAHGRYNVLRVRGRHRLVDWDGLEAAGTPDEFLRATRRSAEAVSSAVLDLRRLIVWLESQPETAAGEIAIVGYSFSAIVGALVLGHEPLVTRGVLVMGGGHLEQVFSRCDRRAGRVRRRALERFGWTATEFEAQVARHLAPIDPVRFPPLADPSAILYIDASRDNCIPESAREDLWAALGYPERIQIHSTHRSAFLTMTVLQGYWLTREIVDFLHRTPSRALPGGGRSTSRVAGSGREQR